MKLAIIESKRLGPVKYCRLPDAWTIARLNLALGLCAGPVLKARLVRFGETTGGLAHLADSSKTQWLWREISGKGAS